MSRIAVDWIDTQPIHRGMSQTEYNRLRDRLDKQTWTEEDVKRLQERVRRIRKGDKRG